MTPNTQTMVIGFAGSKNCTLVNNPGAAIEWLESPAMPATAPQIKPLIRLAISGRFSRTATPYSAGSEIPAMMAEAAAANAVWRSSGFLVFQATARDEPPRERLAPISDGMTIPSLPVSAMVWMMVGVKTRCIPVITSSGQSAPMIATESQPR